MDALFLEEPALPKEIWIAKRSDGIKGSGTQNDPFDGGTRQGPQIGGTPSYAAREVIAFIFGHGYSDGDNVQIANVTGPGASSFNGTFNGITVLNDNEFSFTLLSDPAGPPSPLDYQISSQKTGQNVIKQGLRLFWPVATVDTGATNHDFRNFEAVTMAGAVDPAFNGTFPIVGVESTMTKFRYRPAVEPSGISSPSCTCSKVIHRFDETIQAAPENAIIRLGPGTFETRGGCSAYIKSQYDYSQLFVGFAMKTGQKLIGSGMDATVLKVVYAVDSLSDTGAPGSYVVMNHGEASDFTVDCNLGGQLVPAKADFAPVVCSAAGFRGSYNRLRRIRAINWGTQASAECFVLDTGGHYSDPTGGANNVISECVVEKPSENNTHESTTINNSGADLVKGNGWGLVIRNCFVNCGYANGVSSVAVAVNSITMEDFDASIITDTFLESGILPWFCLDLLDQAASVCLEPGPVAFGTLTTKRPHNRVEGNNVVIFGVGPGGHVLNDSFKVVRKISDTQLIFKFTSPPIPFPLYDASRAAIGVDFHGPGASAGSGCVTEGNSVYDCRNAFYTDTGTSRSLVVRNNYYSNFVAGVNIHFPPGQGEGERAGASLINVPSGSPYAKFVTKDVNGQPAPHRLSVGQAVQIAGALVGGSSTNPYNGFYVVEAIIDSLTFTYKMDGHPSADTADAGSPLTFRALWQIFQFIIENNVYDVYRTENNSYDNPQGIGAWGYHPPPPYIFPQMIVRENLMRRLDGAPSVAVQGQYLPVGVRVYSVEKGIIQENIIDLDDPNPNRHLWSNSVKSFNNTTASGILVRGHDETPPENINQKDDELATMIEDATLLAI